MTLDHTHDPEARSWVESANVEGCDWPIQNLPLGVGSVDGQDTILTAIGDQVVDLRSAVAAGAIPASAELACALSATTLNALMGQGRDAATALRHALFAALRDESHRAALAPSMHAAAGVEMRLPASIGDYSDFYASVHHATNIGSMFRPDNPLMPNYKHLPVGYHGRASSIVVSGSDVRRPSGQTAGDDAPTYGPSRLLDYELEMGIFVAAGNAMGEAIPMDRVEEHLFGMVLLNDWSARDVQKWEYQPLGPFNAKNFASSISPWIVTMDALAPFKVPGPPRGEEDPPTLDYLAPVSDLGLAISVEAHLSSASMRKKGMEPMQLSSANYADMFWTIGQMVAHHASTGCNLRPGDLLGSGTVSGPDPSNRGCLLELTWRGEEPIDLPDGTQRKLLQDGDEVILRGFCRSEGVASIGFGECRGVVLPAT